MNDEYLLLSQAAYLLNQTKRGMETLIDTGKIGCALFQGRRLIRVSELRRYVQVKMDKYKMARTYFAAANKSSFWQIQKKNFHNQGVFHDESLIEYLTVSQVAFLLDLSRQAVHGLLKRGKIKVQYVEWPGHIRPLIFIRADELERYLRKKDETYKKALEFFQSEDSFVFWKSHASDFEENWQKKNKEITHKYYERKKNKVQASAGAEGKTGTAGAAQPGKIAGQVQAG